MKKLEIDQNEKIDKATYFSFFLMGLCSLLCMYFMGQHNLIGFLLSSILFDLLYTHQNSLQIFRSPFANYLYQNFGVFLKHFQYQQVILYNHYH